MPKLGNIRVQHTGQDINALVMDLNRKLDAITRTVDSNRLDSGINNVIFVTSVNAAQPVWLSTADYTLESMSATLTSGTGSVTPRIDSVSVGGVAFSVTTAPTKFIITTPNTIADLQLLDVSTSGLTGVLTLSFELRRLN